MLATKYNAVSTASAKVRGFGIKGPKTVTIAGGGRLSAWINAPLWDCSSSRWWIWRPKCQMLNNTVLEREAVPEPYPGGHPSPHEPSLNGTCWPPHVDHMIGGRLISKRVWSLWYHAIRLERELGACHRRPWKSLLWPCSLAYLNFLTGTDFV